jgi:hypothetical protein
MKEQLNGYCFSAAMDIQVASEIALHEVIHVDFWICFKKSA